MRRQQGRNETQALTPFAKAGKTAQARLQKRKSLEKARRDHLKHSLANLAALLAAPCCDSATAHEYASAEPAKSRVNNKIGVVESAILYIACIQHLHNVHHEAHVTRKLADEGS